jgi:predicted PurR-regulated permease PerM
MILIPSLVTEIEDLIAGIPEVAKTVFDSIQTGLPRILKFLRIESSQLEQSLLEEIPSRVEGLFVNLLKGVVGVGAFLGQIFNLIIIPLLTFYFLKDFNRLKDAFLDIIPRKKRAICIFYAWRMNRILGGYLRGQLIVCVIVGIFTGLGLTLFRIPFALLIGVAAGILNIIPFVGYWITLGLCILTALFTPDVLLSLIKIVGVFMTIQVIEAYVISPKIVGERVGLHPLAVIFSVLVFARFLGFIGLLIAVPTTALLKFLLDEWRRRQKWKEIMDGKDVNLAASHAEGDS